MKTRIYAAPAIKGLTFQRGDRLWASWNLTSVDGPRFAEFKNIYNCRRPIP